MNSKSTRILSAILACSILGTFCCGCSKNDSEKPTKRKKAEVKNLFEQIEPNEISADYDLEWEARSNMANMGLSILSEEMKSKSNTMISPLSLLTALAMISNGAEGTTREEFEDLFGMSIKEANSYIYCYTDSLPTEYSSFNNANALWINDTASFTVRDEFLQCMADYYNSNVFKETFGADTVKNINSFVDKNTDSMIPSIIDSLEPDAELVLVNALSFDGEWRSKFDIDDTHDSLFTNLDGTQSTVSMMNSSNAIYLSFDNGCGFVKDYKNGEYSFVALLPDEDININDFVSSLSGEDFINIVTTPTPVDSLKISLPRFSSEYSSSLKDTLVTLGLVSAFDNSADFSGISTDTELLISEVIHKTFIEVGEEGTRAAAATIVETGDGCAAITEEPTYVILDRPFLYAIVDTQTRAPIFLGVVTDL